MKMSFMIPHRWTETTAPSNVLSVDSLPNREEDFSQQIVTCHETWIHHYTPGRKQAYSEERTGRLFIRWNNWVIKTGGYVKKWYIIVFIKNIFNKFLKINSDLYLIHPLRTFLLFSALSYIYLWNEDVVTAKWDIVVFWIFCYK